ncbi:MAG: methylenetetrahydrofolate reductase [Acidimicrobiales bacterium]
MRKSFSVELWPARNPSGQDRLVAMFELLEKLRPDFTSVTYGAGGSTRDRTQELVNELVGKDWSYPVAHITCVGHSRAQLASILLEYQRHGVEHVLALRGDHPRDSDAGLSRSELKHAIELVELAKSLGFRSVGVAAHPQGHPESDSLERDREFLARKLEIADYALTQFYFDADAYPRLVDDLARLGSEKPIIAGVMAPKSWNSLSKMALLSGTHLPKDLAERFATTSDFEALGIEVAIALAQSALSDGAPGIHLYTMNSALSTAVIFEALAKELGRNDV